MITVLVIDDHPNRNLTEFLGEGFHVIYETDSNNAAKTFSIVKPDIVLLDINMPDKNGYEISLELSEIPHICVIVFMTAKTKIVEEIKGLARFPVHGYFCKPFLPGLIGCQIQAMSKLNQMKNLNPAKKNVVAILTDQERTYFDKLDGINLIYSSEHEFKNNLQEKQPAIIYISTKVNEVEIYKNIAEYRRKVFCSVISVQPHKFENTELTYLDRIAQSLEYGADDYIELPINIELLTTRITHNHVYKCL